MLFIEYPKCTTCQKARKWLEAQGVSLETRHIKDVPPTAAELGDWHSRSGLPLRRSPRVVAAVTHKPPQTLANTHFFQISFPTICHGFLLITAIF